MALNGLTILVPQGAEYQAVCRGVKRGGGSRVTVLSIPVGIQPVLDCLQGMTLTQPTSILVMGLCGSLSSELKLGDRLLYRDCVAPTLGSETYNCDPILTQILGRSLSPVPPQVRALTSDRLVCLGEEKTALGQTYQAQVVDMEGAAVLEFGRSQGMAIAMLRVVSDEVQHTLPDLSAALDSQGTLQPLPLALGMIRQPLAAARLIRGALVGLRALETMATEIATGLQ